jgi:hypothetical protein
MRCFQPRLGQTSFHRPQILPCERIGTDRSFPHVLVTVSHYRRHCHGSQNLTTSKHPQTEDKSNLKSSSKINLEIVEGSLSRIKRSMVGLFLMSWKMQAYIREFGSLALEEAEFIGGDVVLCTQANYS